MKTSKSKTTFSNKRDKVEADLSDKDEDNSMALEALIGQEISVSDNSSLAKKVCGFSLVQAESMDKCFINSSSPYSFMPCKSLFSVQVTL